AGNIDEGNIADWQVRLKTGFTLEEERSASHPRHRFTTLTLELRKARGDTRPTELFFFLRRLVQLRGAINQDRRFECKDQEPNETAENSANWQPIQNQTCHESPHERLRGLMTHIISGLADDCLELFFHPLHAAFREFGDHFSS